MSDGLLERLKHVNRVAPSWQGPVYDALVAAWEALESSEIVVPMKDDSISKYEQARAALEKVLED